ncbi:unnamed protein product [Microthlaspi erraticum]|uniref:VTT domain-containing protein n=1 Tax=Microthlaspi erraticum TaxID=1685480 RepID=A0A6D2JQ74_9BRAS|nr:unnamed protein product [Microthlaspi erraticum]CAA7056119.1 unnamed protein product [Microthlaspi erraticum]
MRMTIPGLGGAVASDPCIWRPCPFLRPLSESQSRCSSLLLSSPPSLFSPSNRQFLSPPCSPDSHFACKCSFSDNKLKDFLLWIKEDLGPFGPLALALAYIPLTIVAVPASVLTLGGGYLFGLPVGFVADSLGATLGATAAFLLGRTIGRSYVTSKIKHYPKFQAVSVAIQRSGFKIVLLLRIVPILPFNMLNYLLSVTPVRLGEYMLATWLGMMPITFALVYVGTTLKDLSDITHGWHEMSVFRWVVMMFGVALAVILIICVTRVAKSSLDKALAENATELDGKKNDDTSMLPIVEPPPPDHLHESLIIRIDPSNT